MREQAMCMIARAMNMTGLKTEFQTSEASKFLARFGDADKSADYAKANIAACIKAGVVSGKRN